MNQQRPAAPEARTTYRTDFTLSDSAWDALSAEAERLKLTGRLVMERLLEQWAYAHPSSKPHPRPAPKPRPAPAAWSDGVPIPPEE